MEINALAGDEEAITIECKGHEMIGILHKGTADIATGMLMIVGGRQYRAGAHRQYVRLARYLALSGVSVLRFDVRGMGDSAGEQRHFLELNDDIHCAVTALREKVSTVTEVAIWGLCDGASAAVIYGGTDPHIPGVMMVNPWISTDSGVARTYLKHYYRERILDLGFWRNLVSGRLDLIGSVLSLFNTMRRAQALGLNGSVSEPEIPDIIFDRLSRYRGNVGILVSDRDLTAREFEDEFHRRSKAGQFDKVNSIELTRVSADHTFSSDDSHLQLCRITVKWINSFSRAKRQK